MIPDTVEGYRLFHDGQIALSEVERAGIKVDVAYLDSAIAKVSKDVADKEEKLRLDPFFRKNWQRLYGAKANLNSGHQLRGVLKALGVATAGRTAKGDDMAVDQKSLALLDIPFMAGLNAYRKRCKVLGTYLQGIKREVTDKGFLHPSYNLASARDDDDAKGGAASLRGSASDPNFQNIPIRDKDMGALIRPCFIARKGRCIVSRDLSGIEVRVSCCYHKDPQMIKEFTGAGGDPHGRTAAQLFLLDYKDVCKKTTRDSAKNMFVFPQFYGSVHFQCAPPIWRAMEERDFRVGEDGITIREHLRRKGITELGECDPEKVNERGTRQGTFVHLVKQVEEDFWQRRFKVYTQWKKDWWELYCTRGWFPLKTGFVCKGYYRRNQVLNFAIQGSAFHCLLWSIIETQRILKKEKMKSLIVGQIHDDMLGDVPECELQDYLDITEDVMSNRLREAWDWITVPVESEASVTPAGGNWLAKKEWKKVRGVWQAT